MKALAGVLAWTAVTVAFTWPIGNLADPVVARHDDTLFSAWRLGWVAHQLPRDLAHLFDTNVFFPEPNTLAYSDAMLLLGLLAAPAVWLGVPLIIVHNLLVIAAFVTAAMAMMRLAAYFTPDRAAQAIAGIVFAFAPFRATHIAHLELLWTAFIPLAVLALYRLVERPTPARGVAFGGAVGLQGLCSIYYVVFLAIWLPAALALSRWHIGVPFSRRHLAYLGVAVVTAAVILSPYALPYAKARAALGPRVETDIHSFSATASDYTRASMHNRTYPAALRARDDERGLTLGIVGWALTILGVALVRSRTSVALAILTLLAIELSLGANGVLFGLIHRIFPAIDGFRAFARFGVLALLGGAALCGLAVAKLLQARPAPQRYVLASALALLLLADYWIAPVTSYVAPLRAGPLETWLAAQPPTVLAAVPFPDLDESTGYETVFQYLSTFHWHPMVNGYSGHAPPGYRELASSMQNFPSDALIDTLRDRGVQLVIFSERYSEPGQFDRFLYACHNRDWFNEVHVFSQQRYGRSAACRLAP